MHLHTDIYIHQEVDADRLIRATAQALGVDARTIQVVPAGTPRGLAALQNPESTVVYQREPDDQPGDFPARFAVSINCSGAEFLPTFASIAKALAVAILSDIDTPDGDSVWRLFLPDGTTRLVEIDRDTFDGDALVLRPQDRANVERITAQSRHRIAA